jgi:hypothetical protein
MIGHMDVFRRHGGVGLGVIDAIRRGEQQRNTHPKEDSWQPKQN